MIARIFSSLYGVCPYARHLLTFSRLSPFRAKRFPFYVTAHAVKLTHAHCRTTVKSERFCFY
ncbi:hypothetical protein FS473_03720 [Escherichia coli]|nr:hypothetical protein [Escherichia coli]